MGPGYRPLRPRTVSSIHRPSVSQTLAWRWGLAPRSQVRAEDIAHMIVIVIRYFVLSELTLCLLSDGTPMEDMWRRHCASCV